MPETALKQCAVCQNFVHCTSAGYCNCGAYSVRQETTAPNIYLSPKVARFLVLAIEGYCQMLEHANKHQGEDCRYCIDNDISMYQAVSQAIGELHRTIPQKQKAVSAHAGAAAGNDISKGGMLNV